MLGIQLEVEFREFQHDLGIADLRDELRVARRGQPPG